VQQAVQDYYGLDAQHADLADDRIVNCLCIIDNKIAGLAQVKPAKPDADPHRFELSRFYVDTHYHGKGIAPALMRETIDIIRLRSAQSLWLSTWQGSSQAIRFYQKQGFTIFGETIFMIGNDPMKDWVMSREL
jgi:diamine N-acetyltransferase